MSSAAQDAAAIGAYHAKANLAGYHKRKTTKRSDSERKWGAFVAKPRVQGTLDSWLKNESRHDPATDGGTAAAVHD